MGRAGDRLLWAHDDRAYLAMHDGATIVEGDSVWFDEGRTMIAAGHVTSVLHGELALVTITAGSLGAAARPERLLVSVMPRSTPSFGSVRVALPANGRGNLIVRCGGVLPHLPREAPAYRTDTLDARHLRLTRSGEAASSNGWPDTLNVVLFDDASDEEIALERGDVDVAVFWPGEGSRRARTDPRWRGFPLGVRSGGVVALTGGDDVTDLLPDSSQARALNDALFQGDLSLRPLPGVTRGAGFPWDVPVDTGMPGHERIRTWMRRTLDMIRKPPPNEADAHGRRISLVEAPPDSVASPSFRPIFALRCPVLCAEPMRRWVDAVGADALASMVQCR